MNNQHDTSAPPSHKSQWAAGRSSPSTGSVWVVTAHEDYEATLIVAIYSNKEMAMARKAKIEKAQRAYSKKFERYCQKIEQIENEDDWPDPPRTPAYYHETIFVSRWRVISPNDLMERIKAVAGKMGLSDAEVIRLATTVGLEQLRRIDYDIARAIVNAAAQQPSNCLDPSQEGPEDPKSKRTDFRAGRLPRGPARKAC